MKESEEIFIPTLHTFAMNNIFTGSKGLFRFRIKPEVQMEGKEVLFESSVLHAVCWHGLFCFEKSEMEDQADFPLTPQGREDMIRWLYDHV